MFKKISIFILVLSVLVCSFSFVVSAEDSSPSIVVFNVSSGYTTIDSSVPFSYSANSLTFDRSGSSIFWVLFNFSGINSSDLLNGSFSFSVTYNGYLSTVSNYYGLFGFNGVSYESIGSVTLMGNRADFFIDSGTILSDYDHFAFRCGVTTAPDSICSFSFSNLIVNTVTNVSSNFLSDISSFLSSVLGFVVIIIDFVLTSPLFIFFAIIVILFVLYLFYRVKRNV